MASDDSEALQAIGQAEPRSDEDLDRLSEVSDADLEDAATFWREQSPARWRGLVDAETREA